MAERIWRTLRSGSIVSERGGLVILLTIDKDNTQMAYPVFEGESQLPWLIQ